MVEGYVEMFQRDVPAEGLHHRKAAGIFKDGTSHRRKILDVLGGRQEICRSGKAGIAHEPHLRNADRDPGPVLRLQKGRLQQPSDPDPRRLIAVRTLTPGPKSIPSVQTRSQRFGHTHGGDVFSTANYCCSTLFFSSFRAAHKL